MITKISTIEDIKYYKQRIINNRIIANVMNDAKITELANNGIIELKGKIAYIKEKFNITEEDIK